MECPKCSDDLMELSVSSEPQGIRSDRYCLECNTRFALYNSGLVIISEPINTAAIVAENMALKTTIRTMMAIKAETECEIWSKTYSSEDVADIDRDIHEAISDEIEDPSTPLAEYSLRIDMQYVLT